MAYSAIVTTLGLAKIAAAIGGGDPVDLTEMAVGDGNGNPTTPDPAQTALVRQRYRGAITSMATSGLNPNQLILDLLIQASEGGWSISEVGVFDADGDLIVVANFPQTYKPLPAEGAARDLVVRILVEVANASVITLNIDPTIVAASRQWVVDNFSLAAQIPGGTTQQVLRKKSNTDGDVEWANPSDANITVDIVQESQTLAAEQTIVDLATCTTDGMALYIEGIREFDFDVNSATRITLPRSYPAGTIIYCVQNDPYGGTQFARKDVENTFTEPQIVPDGTEDGHTVNKGQMEAAIAAVRPAFQAGRDDGSLSVTKSTGGGSQTLTTSPVIFDFEYNDAEGVYNNTNGQFTAPSAGLYQFHAHCIAELAATWDSPYSGDYDADVTLELMYSGNAMAFAKRRFRDHKGQTSEIDTLSLSHTANLAQGDVITVRIVITHRGVSGDCTSATVTVYGNDAKYLQFGGHKI